MGRGNSSLQRTHTRLTALQCHRNHKGSSAVMGRAVAGGSSSSLLAFAAAACLGATTAVAIWAASEWLSYCRNIQRVRLLYVYVCLCSSASTHRTRAHTGKGPPPNPAVPLALLPPPTPPPQAHDALRPRLLPNVRARFRGDEHPLGRLCLGGVPGGVRERGELIPGGKCGCGLWLRFSVSSSAVAGRSRVSRQTDWLWPLSPCEWKWTRRAVLLTRACTNTQICVAKRRAFPKAVKLYDVLRVFGENVVTTEGEGACLRVALTRLMCLM